MNHSTYYFIVVRTDLLYGAGGKIAPAWKGLKTFIETTQQFLLATMLNSLGPIGCVSMHPLRLYPWACHKMLDQRQQFEI